MLGVFLTINGTIRLQEVLFKFRPDITTEEGIEILKYVKALKDKVPEVETVQLGVNFNTEKANGYTHVFSGFTMTFKNKDALETYDKSEAHVDAVENYLSHKCMDILIFDYELEGFSVPPPSTN
ncbi:hypothetical protein BGZ65_011576 [Modicella reniformis]|uniref:Stress-response A/B barrel domain-containing protein n=1 Tax=Modicella reniformis TaxID=1440133 RepID=A0A9P6IN51_9FUNG|nr:hypothetical protein BGZ65_011576 [Modicella reniformis]